MIALISESRGGHRVVESMEEFSRRVSPRLIGVLVLQYGSHALAEDLAQEAMARTWERWAEVGQMNDPQRWTYRVAFNLAASAFRRRGAEQRALRRSAEPATAHAEDGADRLALRHALKGLPERQRAAVVLRYYGQLSVAETSEVMGCAQGTVRALTSQGVAGLRESLGIELGDERDEGGHG